MNQWPINQPFPQGQPYAPQRIQSVRIMLDRKIFYQHRIVAEFGVERLTEILNSNDPFIFPVISYHNSFDMLILILT